MTDVFDSMPTELIKASEDICLWFAERNINEWALGGLQSRQAVQAEQDVPVYTPMTHDERRLSGVLDTEFTDREHGVVFIERAVIERLGMRWPE